MVQVRFPRSEGAGVPVTLRTRNGACLQSAIIVTRIRAKSLGGRLLRGG